MIQWKTRSLYGDCCCREGDLYIVLCIHEGKNTYKFKIFVHSLMLQELYVRYSPKLLKYMILNTLAHV